MTADFKSVDVQTAKRLFDAGAHMIDIRTQRDWAAGHVEGSDLVGSGRVSASVIGRADSIVAVCANGAKSRRTAKRLAKAGYQVYHLSGGLKAWQAAGFPLNSTNGRRPEIL